MAHSAYRRLVKLVDEDLFIVPVEVATGFVRASAGPRVFDGVQFEPGSVIMLRAVEVFEVDDLIEWPHGSGRYHRVQSSVPRPPFGVVRDVTATLEDTVPLLAFRVLIAGDNVLYAGATVYL